MGYLVNELELPPGPIVAEILIDQDSRNRMFYSLYSMNNLIITYL